MNVRPARKSDRDTIQQMLAKDTFIGEEIDVALECVDEGLESDEDYLLLVATDEGDRAVGYLCYGPTPMTAGTYDLYWLCTDAEHRGKGVGKALVARMEDDVHGAGGRVVRVETSHKEAYGAARGFYDKNGYETAGRIPDFYRPGDDLLILCKRIGG